MFIFVTVLFLRKVGKFSIYKIPLRGLSEGTHKFDYTLNTLFFKQINDDESDLNGGQVEVNVTVKRNSSFFELDFTLVGEVSVPCDRCLDDMPIEINTKNHLVVKFGAEYSEESDEIVVIPEEDGEINIAWFLYEFISLSIPMKHVHVPGKCNKIMSSKLNKHKATSVDDEDDEEDTDEEYQSEDDNTDNRWDTLKDLNIEE